VPSDTEILRATEAVEGIGESFLTYYYIITGRRKDETYTLLENLFMVVDLGAS